MTQTLYARMNKQKSLKFQKPKNKNKKIKGEKKRKEREKKKKKENKGRKIYLEKQVLFQYKFYQLKKT
jgi:hypothetical protein